MTAEEKAICEKALISIDIYTFLYTDEGMARYASPKGMIQSQLSYEEYEQKHFNFLQEKFELLEKDIENAVKIINQNKIESANYMQKINEGLPISKSQGCKRPFCGPDITLLRIKRAEIFNKKLDQQ